LRLFLTTKDHLPRQARDTSANVRNGVQSCSFNGHGMPACSGAGKALAAMMSAGGEGEHAEVHEFVKTVLAPARFVAAEAAAAM
jgi:hypothetical protein